MPQAASIVFVVDDDISVRESLELLIRSEGWQPQIFPSAQHFLSYPRKPVPSCLVLDISMPGLNGLELQKRVAVEHPHLPIIFITGHGDVPMAVEAMQAGAFDFLQKPFRDQDLVDCIQRALEKDRASRVMLSERGLLRERLESLTPREREVLELVTSGSPNKAMATQLGVSQRTVEIHRARVMEKMGAASLAQLVRMVMDLDEKPTQG